MSWFDNPLRSVSHEVTVAGIDSLASVFAVVIVGGSASDGFDAGKAQSKASAVFLLAVADSDR